MSCLRGGLTEGRVSIATENPLIVDTRARGHIAAVRLMRI